MQSPPVFSLYTLEALEKATGYSLTYLVNLKTNPAIIPPGFRRKVAKMLRQSDETQEGAEKRLFG